MHADAALIKALGGAAKVAALLNYDKESGGVQRVHNWMTRGIPSRVKLERPDLFLLPQEKKRVVAQANNKPRTHRDGPSHHSESK